MAWQTERQNPDGLFWQRDVADGRFATPAAAVERLAEIMRRLRAPGGCPWDREQDLKSLRPYLIEEAYEVLEEMDRVSAGAPWGPLAEELGDVGENGLLEEAVDGLGLDVVARVGEDLEVEADGLGADDVGGDHGERRAGAPHRVAAREARRDVRRVGPGREVGEVNVPRRVGVLGGVEQEAVVLGLPVAEANLLHVQFAGADTELLRPFRGWQQNQRDYEFSRLLCRARFYPGTPRGVTRMWFNMYVATKGSVKGQETRPDGLAKNPETNYQAMFRHGSHQSGTRAWLGPTLQTVEDLRADPQLRHRGILVDDTHPHAGPFTYIGETVNPKTRRVTIRCAVPNPDGRLKPEMYATVQVGDAAPTPVLTVASGAVQTVNGQPSVFLADA